MREDTIDEMKKQIQELYQILDKVISQNEKYTDVLQDLCATQVKLCELHQASELLRKTN